MILFIGPESDHWQCLTLVSDSLTHSCLVNLIDVTLACEDGSSELDEVVTVADVSDEGRVGNRLLQIWKLRFVQTLSTLVKILKLKFRRNFEAEVWSVFCC